MLKRHEIQVLRRAAHTYQEIATLTGVPARSVRRIAAESTVTTTQARSCTMRNRSIWVLISPRISTVTLRFASEGPAILTIFRLKRSPDISTK